jgi:hypothetical protein
LRTNFFIYVSPEKILYFLINIILYFNQHKLDQNEKNLKTKQCKNIGQQLFFKPFLLLLVDFLNDVA